MPDLKPVNPPDNKVADPLPHPVLSVSSLHCSNLSNSHVDEHANTSKCIISEVSPGDVSFIGLVLQVIPRELLQEDLLAG